MVQDEAPHDQYVSTFNPGIMSVSNPARIGGGWGRNTLVSRKSCTQEGPTLLVSMVWANIDQGQKVQIGLKCDDGHDGFLVYFPMGFA